MNSINSNYNTTQSVASALFNSNTVLAYQGMANPGAVFTAISVDGSSWSDSAFKPVPGTEGCTSAPMLISFNNVLYLFYCTAPGGNVSTIKYVTTKDGLSWTAPVPMPPSFNSDLVLSGLVNNNRLFVYYKGFGGSNIFGAHMDTAGNWSAFGGE